MAVAWVAAMAQIWSLAQKLSRATGTAKKKKKKKKKKIEWEQQAKLE